MYLPRTRRAKLLLLSSSFALIAYFVRRYRRYLILKKRRSLAAPREQTLTNVTAPSPIKKALNKQFLHQLRVLVRILIPSVRSDSFILLLIHLTTLMTRTFLSIYIAHLDGAIVKSLVQRNARDFIRSISIFIGVAIPASFINSLIRFAEAKLALAFRTKLSRYAYEAYFRVSVRFDLIFNLNFIIESNLFSRIKFG
jgi:ABC-type uncharacterized transport system fused permease/ATPase subunit